MDNLNLELKDNYIKGFVDLYNAALALNDEKVLDMFRDHMYAACTESVEYALNIILDSLKGR